MGGHAIRALVLVCVSIGLLAFAFPAAADTCAPSCEVVSVGDATLQFAFVPAVLFVESGSSVTWRAVDPFPHTASERFDVCFHTSFSRAVPGSVRLFVADGEVWGAGEDEATPCTGAVASPDGTFVLDYFCFVHPNMQARLVVR